jgi:hypothetical protein
MNFPYSGDPESWDCDGADTQRAREVLEMERELGQMREIVRAGLPQWLWRSMTVREAAAVAYFAQLPDPSAALAQEHGE